MEQDDPTAGEFASWLSYQWFARSVRHRRRYVWTDDENAFLAAVRATIHDRDVELPEGMILFRAQRGIDWRTRTDSEDNEIGEEPIGYGALRMMPRIDQATEGRANPAGISVLYLGTTTRSAISEVRPWIGAWVSVAQFKIRRSLKALDLSRGHGRSSFSEVGFHHLGTEPLNRERKEKAVWIDIDNAFSRPVTLSDDAADYVPTQILSELFRDAGYDAIVYKSQFGEEGFNIVLFNPNDAYILNCAPYEVTGLELSFKQSGDHWFTKQPEG
ncbi:RES family NAD+ phosphorylase [Mesorhizobium sp. CA13]|uniref:RES family NAD+ phosphorylase n=1 Tax=Mesorhizobium sp. CA13 TaxID=2876643 RepID=UPI001CC9C1EB|nr:RES family NAD+ phosphorylase [Mesorhizobium sp. CA13]MBZ9857071.1 RES family NAD+ phosphorylase [Mesorhizobium sp. CA13]